MQFIPGVNSVIDANAGGWALIKNFLPLMETTF
jgi:hypothetical protein